jgi:hypothetical protein
MGRYAVIIRTVMLGVLTLAALPSPVLAQNMSPPPAEKVLNRACAGRNGQSISTQRLAEALVIVAGHFPSDFARGGARLSDVIWQLSDPNAQAQGDMERQLAGAVQTLEAKFRLPLEAGATRVENAPQNFKWLFDPTRDWSIKCGGEAQTPPSFEAEFSDPTPHPLFVLRGSVDDLTDQGKDRLKSSALKLGYTRTRSVLDDGSRKTDTGLTVNGTLGVRLTSKSDTSNVVHAFASYSLSRERSRPAAMLAAGVDENDGDTDTLEAGVAGHFQLTRNESVFKVFSTLKGSILSDFVHDSRIGRLGMAFEPIILDDLGLCKLGSFKPLIEGGNGLYARCAAQVEVEGAHVFKAGTSEFGISDEYLATGVNGKIEFFSPTFGDDGIFAKAGYRYLPVVHGKLNNIKRFDAEIAYRIWSESKVGFDVGLTYARGTNAKSFEKDNSLVLGVGILF